MNPTKTVPQKPVEDTEQSSNSLRAKAPKKSTQQPVKVKKTEAAKKAPKKSDEPRMAWWFQFRQYLREVGSELRKVVWPTRKETIGSTSVVLVIVILSGIFLGVVDLVLSRLVRLFVG